MFCVTQVFAKSPQSVCSPVRVPICPSVHPFVYPCPCVLLVLVSPVLVFTGPCVRLSLCLPVLVSSCPCVHPLPLPYVLFITCPDVYLSLSPSIIVSLSLCPPVHVTPLHWPPVLVSTCPCVHLSLCPLSLWPSVLGSTYSYSHLFLWQPMLVSTFLVSIFPCIDLSLLFLLTTEAAESR
jgi:hypothetical protein